MDEARAPVSVNDDEDLAALVALAGLPNLSPRRLWSLIELGPLQSTWRRVSRGAAPRSGRSRDPAQGWAGWSAVVDPVAELARHRQMQVEVTPFGHEHFPVALLDDPDPPAVLFRQGPEPLAERPRIAIVGTRSCTRYGLDVAHELGAKLAQRGVDVVSGLATGIDAAAHAGAATADTSRIVAVVAGGVDVIYPTSNGGLFAQAAATGSLLSEWPLGARPSRWRFPARNRLVAALSAAVVVVESRPKGGSMYTVDEALARNRAIFAVPGSIRSPVSAGTNRLIADGAHSLYDIDHLVEAVTARGPDSVSAPLQSDLGLDSWLLGVIGWEPLTLDRVVEVSGRSPSEVTLEIERLVAQGVIRRFGAVVERVA